MTSGQGKTPGVDLPENSKVGQARGGYQYWTAHNDKRDRGQLIRRCLSLQVICCGIQ